MLTSLPISPEEFISKHLEGIVFKKVLSSHIMYTTVLAELEKEGLIIIKMRNDDFADQMKNNLIEIKKMISKINKMKEKITISKHPNLLPIELSQSFSSGVTMGFRQFICNSLSDRMAQVPKLEIIQKKWITFQLIHAVKQLQSVDEFHGNITPSNIFLTSNDWVLLTDCMFYKKTYLGENDHQSNIAFFGDIINKKCCYVAPERFLTDKMFQPEASKEDLFAMDIFSLGCIISEIFRDGRPLFDLPKLMEFKKGNIIIDKEFIQQEITKDNIIGKIIHSMITIDPKKRSTIDFCLKSIINDSGDEGCPSSFQKILYPICAKIMQPEFVLEDDKIGLLSREIIKANCSLNPIVFQKVKRIGSSEGTIKDKFRPSLIQIEEKSEEKCEEVDIQLSDELLIVLNIIANIFPYTNYPSSRICALEMINYISDNLRLNKSSKNEPILRYILPHLVKFIAEETHSLVKCKIIETMIHCLKNMEEVLLDPVDFRVFPEYILPFFFEKIFYEESSFLVEKQSCCELTILTIIRNIGEILEIADKFKYLAQLSIAQMIRNSESNSKEIPIEKYKYLEKSLSDNTNYAQGFAIKAFKICSQVDNKVYITEYLKQMTQVYYSIGSKSFEKYIYPNLKDCIINGNTFAHVAKAIRLLPTKNESISSSMICYSSQEIKPCLEYLTPFLDPIIRVFILNEVADDEIFKDSVILKESLLSKICSSLGVKGISSLKIEDYSPFLKPEISKKIYEFFKDNWTITLNSKLRTSQSISYLKSLILETDDSIKDSNFEVKPKTKDSILAYNDLKLLKKKLKAMNFADNVYECKIKKDQIPYYSKAIQDITGYRKRTKSNVDDTILKQNLNDKVQYDLAKYQRRSDLHYYPDIAKTSNDNFGLNQNDSEDLSCIQNDRQRFTESMNSNKDQSIIQYYLSMKSDDKYKVEDGFWEPKGNLVNTIYDQNDTFSTINDLDVSQNSKYFVAVSSNGIKVWNCQNIMDINEVFDIYSNQSLNCCCMLDCSYAFVTGSNKGTLDLYSPFEFEDKSSSVVIKDSFLKSCYLMNRINHSGEGAIIDCKSKVLEAEREHCVIYATQNGYVHIYDLRSRNSVFTFNVGLKYGLINCMNFSPKTDQMLIGTLDGSLLTYDFKYNAQVSHCKYSVDASITNIQPFYPYRHRRFKFNNANYLCPLAFISTSDAQISLIDLTDKGDDTKENQVILTSRRSTDKGDNIGKFLEKPNTSWNSNPSETLKPSIYDSVFGINSKDVYKSISDLEEIKYDSMSSIISSTRYSKILSPHPYSMKSLLCPKNLNFKYSASYLIGGDTTGRIRYWDIERDSNKRKHFYVHSNEKVAYRPILHENSIHIIKDVTIVEEEKASNNEFDIADDNSYSVYDGHTGSVNALGMINM